jgi:hypothetical protein
LPFGMLLCEFPVGMRDDGGPALLS